MYTQRDNIYMIYCKITTFLLRFDNYNLYILFGIPTNWYLY